MTVSNQHRAVRKYIELCRHIPEPGQPFRASHIIRHDPDIDPSVVGNGLLYLQSEGVVQPHGHGYYETCGKRYKVWRVTQEGWETIQRILEGNEDAFLPCGHEGFRNPRGKDGLECKICQSIWSVDEVRA